jgi:hypothetical protein
MTWRVWLVIVGFNEPYGIVSSVSLCFIGILSSGITGTEPRFEN